MGTDALEQNSSTSSQTSPTATDTVEKDLRADEYLCRATDPENLTIVEREGAPTVVEGRMMPYGEPSLVRSAIDSRELGIPGKPFFEIFAPGSLAKTMAEQSTRIRAMFEHGLDASLGKQLIASVDEMREEPDGAYFRATLLDGVPQLLAEGIRKGLYGSSIRFLPLKFDLTRYPRRSESNPEGIPEVTVREAVMKEFSITPFPVYQGATAHVRSITDELAAKLLLDDPVRLLEMMERSEPQHSTPEEPDVPAAEGSRSTQPARDYLNTEEAEPKWLL